MLRYHGGARVRYGYYWNRARWEIVTVPKEGGNLPGGAAEGYTRVPIGLLLLLTPVMGGFYVVFLPFIGFFMILRLAGTKAADALGRALSIMTPAWRPGEVYFAGKLKAWKGAKPPIHGEPQEPESLKALAKEIGAGRKTEE